MSRIMKYSSRAAARACGFKQRGVGLIEVAIAILVISVGALGLASMQLAAKRAGFEAVQRTNATGLAMDILERMRVNPTVMDAYVTTGVGVGSGNTALTTPAELCTVTCTEAQLATLDLYQWEQALDGASEKSGTNVVGGLLNPVGCITTSGAVAGSNSRMVKVVIAWEGFETLSDGIAETCGKTALGANRQLIVIDTFITEN